MSLASISIIGRYLTLSLETCTLFCTTTLNPVLLLMLAFSMPCRRIKIHRRVIFKAFVLICVEVTSTCVLNGSHQGYPEVKMGIPYPIQCEHFDALTLQWWASPQVEYNQDWTVEPIERFHSTDEILLRLRISSKRPIFANFNDVQEVNCDFRHYWQLLNTNSCTQFSVRWRPVSTWILDLNRLYVIGQWFAGYSMCFGLLGRPQATTKARSSPNEFKSHYNLHVSVQHQRKKFPRFFRYLKYSKLSLHWRLWQAFIAGNNGLLEF